MLPEVVEVQIQKEGLQAVVGDKIIQATVTTKGSVIVRSSGGPAFLNFLLGRKIESVNRIGKNLIFNLGDDKYLVSHLAMTGSWLLHQGGIHPVAKHARIVLTLASGRTLTYNDTRLFGRMYARNSSADLQDYVKGLDVFDATVDQIYNVVKNNVRAQRMNLKKFLNKQDILCGIGNAYANQILFDLRVHPATLVGDLSKEEKKTVAHTIKMVIEAGYRHGGLSMRDYYHVDGSRGYAQEFLDVYRKSICPVCEGKITSTKEFDGRSTYFCPACQGK